MMAVLAAAVTMVRSHHVHYRCGWCSSGHHERCPGAFSVPSGELACTCAYTWRHAELWAKQGDTGKFIGRSEVVVRGGK